MQNIKNEVLKPFEDFSNSITKINSSTIIDEIFCYVDSFNKNIISKSSLLKLITFIKNKDYIIVNTIENDLSKNENIFKNRKLRNDLIKFNLGIYQLVLSYNDLNNVNFIKRVYLISRPNNYNLKKFKEDILNISKKNLIDSIYLKTLSGIYLISDNKIKKICRENSFENISKLFVNSLNENILNFEFKGLEIPASNFSKLMFSKNNLSYISPDIDKKSILINSIDKAKKIFNSFECLVVNFNDKENLSKFKAKTLKYGYGITKLIDNVFLIINRKDEDKFYDKVLKAILYFKQELLLYKEMNSDKAYVIKDNKLDLNIYLKNFNIDGFTEYLNEIARKIISYKINLNKDQNRRFLADELLCEETFNKLNNISKEFVSKTSKEFRI